MDTIFDFNKKAILMMVKIAAAGSIVLVVLFVILSVGLNLYQNFYSENSRLIISSYYVIQDEDKVWVFLETRERKNRSPLASPTFSDFPHALHAFLIDESGVKARITCPNDGSVDLNTRVSHLFARDGDICLLCESAAQSDKRSLYKWTGKTFTPLNGEETRALLKAASTDKRDIDDVPFEELDKLTSKSAWKVIGEGDFQTPELPVLDGRVVIFGDHGKISVRSQNDKEAGWEEVLLDIAEIQECSEKQ